ncbi:unnamed protein product, partial [Musa hybrid cultivar]
MFDAETKKTLRSLLESVKLLRQCSRTCKYALTPTTLNTRQCAVGITNRWSF